MDGIQVKLELEVAEEADGEDERAVGEFFHHGLICHESHKAGEEEQHHRDGGGEKDNLGLARRLPNLSFVAQRGFGRVLQGRETECQTIINEHLIVVAEEVFRMRREELKASEEGEDQARQRYCYKGILEVAQ